MRTTHTFAINFLIRRCKDNRNEALIYARITADEDRKEISIKERIKVTDWDTRQEIVKGKSIEIKALNSYIDEVRFKIKQAYRELDKRNALITAETVKQTYLSVHLQQKGHKLVELLDYFDKIWKPKMKAGTYKNYCTTIAYAKLFLESRDKTPDIYLSQLDMTFATDLEDYIRRHPVKAHDPCVGNGRPSISNASNESLTGLRS